MRVQRIPENSLSTCNKHDAVCFVSAHSRMHSHGLNVQNAMGSCKQGPNLLAFPHFWLLRNPEIEMILLVPHAISSCPYTRKCKHPQYSLLLCEPGRLATVNTQKITLLENRPTSCKLNLIVFSEDQFSIFAHCRHFSSKLLPQSAVDITSSLHRENNL